MNEAGTLRATLGSYVTLAAGFGGACIVLGDGSNENFTVASTKDPEFVARLRALADEIARRAAALALEPPPGETAGERKSKVIAKWWTDVSGVAARGAEASAAFESSLREWVLESLRESPSLVLSTAGARYVSPLLQRALRDAGLPLDFLPRGLHVMVEARGEVLASRAVSSDRPVETLCGPDGFAPVAPSTAETKRC